MFSQETFPSHILYGTDYNPEQWPVSLWAEDMRLMKLAHINIVSINIFSWATLEPRQGEYYFETLDRIMNMLTEHGIAADLATATASPPTWMSRLYPSMLPITCDSHRLTHGSRQQYCPNSADYRREAVALVRQLAERYRVHPALSMWHVNNEYGCHVAQCFCDRCSFLFREWLQARYHSLEALNEAWSTDFWSQHYGEWEDILPPRSTPTFKNPSQVVDYHRFMSDSLFQCYLNEARILREVTPTIPITTNFMVAFKPVDYFAWAPALDIVSIDLYPPHTAQAWETALTHDLMRSLKGGRPYLMMEQTPSQVNWMAQNPQKRPANSRLQNLQALAHGADGAMYFQWRQSQGGVEKFHSAIVSHEGSEHNRIFQQAAQIGAELEKLSPSVVGSRVQAQVALIMDWQNWWAVENLPSPSDRLRYWELIGSWYRALHRLNVAIDVVSPAASLSEYRLLIAPLLYMLRPGTAQNLEQFVAQGGTLLTTFFSGIVDEHDRVVLGGYPAELRKLLGIHVEEFDPWTPDMTNEVLVEEGPLQGRYPCSLWGEVVHLEGAQTRGLFARDYYAQGPAITVHQFGAGQAWYIATQGNDDLLNKLAGLLCREAAVSPIMEVPEGIEVTCRVQAYEHSVYFLLNHTGRAGQVRLPTGKFTSLLTDEEVEGVVEIAAQDVVVLLRHSSSS